MVYLCAIVEIQQSFSKNVSFAQTMASIGYSGGSVLAGIIMPPLLLSFGWRGTMALVGATLLNSVAVAYSFRDRPKSSSLSSALSSPSSPDKVEGSISKQTKVSVVRSIFSEALDFSLFKNPMFALLCCARFCVWFAFHCYFSHSPSRAVSVGLTLQQGTFLLSATSIGTFSCRPVLAFVAHKWHISNIITVIIFSLISSGLMVITSFAVEFYALVAMAVINGMAVGK